MSNPPAGWYPDPTGQPSTVRWWNGTQWTNKSQNEHSAGAPQQPPKLTSVPEPGQWGAAPEADARLAAQQPVAPQPFVGSQHGVLGGPQTASGQESSSSTWGSAGEWSATQAKPAANPWQSGGGTGGVGGVGVSSGDGGGGNRGGGARTPLAIAGAGLLVVIIVAGVFFILKPFDDKTAGPTTSPSPQTSTTTPGPTTTPLPPGVTPGQSQNPKLHEGDNRVSSDAISFPRQGAPWSERKRLVPQLLNSSGQYALLQENYDGQRDWYADAFVGALGTATPFNGDPKATAEDLAMQVRGSMYSSVPATFKALTNGEVKRTDKPGWYFQQSVTVNSSKINARSLILTVAVFDLGDGTAVAYISDIPANRPDLKAAEAQVYKGINVG